MQVIDDDIVVEVDDTLPILDTEPLRDPLSKPEPEAAKAEVPEKEAPKGDDDDLEDYGEKVRKRINKEVWRRREAERKVQEAEARLQHMQAQLGSINQRVVQSDDYAITAQESALKAEFDRVQASYKQAYDAGDVDTMFAATDRLAEIKIKSGQIEGWKAQYRNRPQQQPAPQQQQPQQGSDPRAVDWASENEWFGKDAAKTGAAYAIDAQLKSEGIDPRSDEYYEELNGRLQKEFPSLRKTTAAARTNPSQPVAGVSRGTPDKRKVQLSASEVQMAEKLGVSLADYARYKKG